MGGYTVSGSGADCKSAALVARVVQLHPLPPIIWPVGQVVKTPPFHGGIVGSIPARVTTKHLEVIYKCCFHKLHLSIFMCATSS